MAAIAFIAAAPFGVLMSIALYFVMTRMMPAEVKEIPGGREQIRKSLAELGPMKTSEKKLLAVSLTLLLFWATEGVLHSFDTSSTTIAAVALMFLPGVGIMTWKDALSPQYLSGRDVFLCPSNPIGWGSLSDYWGFGPATFRMK